MPSLCCELVVWPEHVEEVKTILRNRRKLQRHDFTQRLGDSKGSPVAFVFKECDQTEVSDNLLLQELMARRIDFDWMIGIGPDSLPERASYRAVVGLGVENLTSFLLDTDSRELVEAEKIEALAQLDTDAALARLGTMTARWNSHRALTQSVRL